VNPFHLDVTKPVFIVGDELLLGVPEPDDLPLGKISAFPIESQSILRDLSDSWQAAHIAWDHGKMGGFIYAQAYNSGANATYAMGYYDRTDIQFYWDYADNYVLNDNFFSSTMTMSTPNHFRIASATPSISTFAIVNSPSQYQLSTLTLTWETLAQELTLHNVS
jgi:phospholipase C